MELGAARIVPVIAQRTESASRERRPRRGWSAGSALPARHQSNRGAVFSPEISQPVNLKEAVNLRTGARIVLAESEDDS